MSNQEGQRERRTINLKLSGELIEKIDALKANYGLRSRGAIVERLLNNLFATELDGDGNAESDGDLDEQGTLVLVSREGTEELTVDLARIEDLAEGSSSNPSQVEPLQTSRGIDLPGFVRKRTGQIRRSLEEPRRSGAKTPDPLPQISAERLEQALTQAHDHWLELYGKEANEAVLEAAMVWLAQDIWPQSDQSDGRPFSWTLACDIMTSLAPAWPSAQPSFERVIVVAGVLEDPFSGSTLAVRIPTLIRRFVHRFRRRRGTSFQTLQHTMTLHGALKLLQLPTSPGHRLTLAHIRDAYRTLALANHPDSGGSEEAMRRLNEAYQLLKELYRQPSP